jgi:Ran GTPase-activating protein (RanGAP) involved in mRNA processing and transport
MDQGAEYLASILKSNQTLTHLWLPKNCITDRGIKSLFEALIDNKIFQIISLEWNAFENDETINSLIKMIDKNQILIHLSIDERDLSRYDIKKLKEIAKLKKGFKLKIH